MIAVNDISRRVFPTEGFSDLASGLSGTVMPAEPRQAIAEISMSGFDLRQAHPSPFQVREG
jgi:hypothetical protein